MSFKLFEIGSQSGRPVSLYEFRWGNTRWRYTSSDREMTFGVDEDGITPKVWTPVAIKDDGVTQGSSPSEFTVSLPANLPIVGLYRSTPPAESIWLTVYRYHFGDAEAQTFWVGTVGNVKRLSIAKAQVFGLPISGTLRRTGLRLCWEKQCPYMLYDQDCKVSKAAFAYDTTITALVGGKMSVAALGTWPGELYLGGFFEWEVNEDGTMDRRGIEGYDGALGFTIFGSVDRLEVGSAVTMYIGCDLSPERCQNVFANLPNHGGFRFMPGKSPFDGTPVF